MAGLNFFGGAPKPDYAAQDAARAAEQKAASARAEAALSKRPPAPLVSGAAPANTLAPSTAPRTAGEQSQEEKEFRASRPGYLGTPKFADGGQVGLQTGVPQQNFNNVMGYQPQAYADGGQVGLGAPQGGMDILRPEQIDSDINTLMADPQTKQKLQQAVQQALQSGELDPQMVEMAIQLCKACVQNPALWPQLRRFAVQKGLAGPNDLPEQYDQGLVIAILTAAKAAEGQMGGAQQQGVQPPAGMGEGSGGMLHGPGTGTSDSIPAQNLANGGPVKVSTGEYIIPADVVRAKGKDFFDGMVKKYHQPAGYQGE